MSLAPSLERLKALPRARFLGAPTPIERLERFEAAIGSPCPVFIKRDDAIPFGFGGNKVRKLELVIAEAESSGADTVITCGGLQSNHCRATAAAAARRGLACHLVLNGVRPEVLTGNARLDDLFGATIHFVPGREDRDPKMAALAASLSERGEKPFVIPLGASTPRGAAGLANGLVEMVDQGHRPDVIVHASSSGGTQAGLLAGVALLGLKTRVIGISADEPAARLARVVEDLERDLLALLLSPEEPLKAEVRDGFVGEGYGRPTEASREAQRLLARSEGLVVDHTYTAKALAGLMSLVREGSLPAGSSILFWHTGGQVGVLA